MTVRVTVLPNGDVATEKLTIVDTVDAETGESVLTALTRWQFKPLVGPPQVAECLRDGTLIFYFRISAGKGTVIDAAAERMIQPAPGNVTRKNR